MKLSSNNMNEKPDNTINIFWTGGRDSSFRVAYLVLIKKIEVQPLYIIDPKRKSTFHELQAMMLMKQKMIEINPDSRHRLLPLKITLLSDICPDPEISGLYHQISQNDHIGKQYEWMAWYAKQFNLFAIEVCQTVRVLEHPSYWGKIMNADLTGTDHDCRVKDEPQYPEMKIFAHFRFPVIHLSKNDMMRISHEQGFHEVMKLTWFCHKPKNDIPCGRCRPCQIAKKDNLFYPEPRRSKYRNILSGISLKLKRKK